jgi:hypothetical protein
VDSSLPLVIFESTSASGLNFHVFKHPCDTLNR